MKIKSSFLKHKFYLINSENKKNQQEKVGFSDSFLNYFQNEVILKKNKKVKE